MKLKISLKRRGWLALAIIAALLWPLAIQPAMARRPWPEKIGNGKWRVWGQTPGGLYLQVIYAFSPQDVVFVIHAMELTEAQKRQYRRRAR